MSGNCRSSGGRSRPRPSWRLCSRASGCSTSLPAREPCRERSPRGGPVPGRRWDWTAPPRCLRSPPHAYRLIGRFSGATPSASRLRIRASTSSAPATCFTCSARTTDAESLVRWRVCSALAGDWSRSPQTVANGSHERRSRGSRGGRGSVRSIHPASSALPGCDHCERGSFRRHGPRCACSASGPRTPSRAHRRQHSVG